MCDDGDNRTASTNGRPTPDPETRINAGLIVHWQRGALHLEFGRKGQGSYLPARLVVQATRIGSEVAANTNIFGAPG